MSPKTLISSKKIRHVGPMLECTCYIQSESILGVVVGLSQFSYVTISIYSLSGSTRELSWCPGSHRVQFNIIGAMPWRPIKGA